MLKFMKEFIKITSFLKYSHISLIRIRDVKVRIGLTWAAFAKLKSILRSPKVKLNFKIRLFKAACILILLYGCETWILTETSMREHAIVSC